MRLYSIDPGWDNFGWAWFDVGVFDDLRSSGEADAEAAIMAMKACGEVGLTGTAEQRIHTISISLTGMSIEERGAAVLIEVPSIEGIYDRNAGKAKAMARSMNRLWMSIGAIAAAMARPNGPQIHFVQADRRPKAERWAMLEPVAEKKGVSINRGARGAKRQDVWDAVELGWRSLATGIVQPHDARAREAE